MDSSNETRNLIGKKMWPAPRSAHRLPIKTQDPPAQGYIQKGSRLLNRLPEYLRNITGVSTEHFHEADRPTQQPQCCALPCWPLPRQTAYFLAGIHSERVSPTQQVYRNTWKISLESPQNTLTREPGGRRSSQECCALLPSHAKQHNFQAGVPALQHSEGYWRALTSENFTDQHSRGKITMRDSRQDSSLERRGGEASEAVSVYRFEYLAVAVLPASNS